MLLIIGNMLLMIFFLISFNKWKYADDDKHHHGPTFSLFPLFHHLKNLFCQGQSNLRTVIRWLK